jgi:hypothetical protein
MLVMALQVALRQQPVKEMKSPSGFGNVGLKGSKGDVLEVSNPAA